MKVKHLKTSLVPNTSNTSLVQPSDWNADHVVSDVEISDVNGLEATLASKVSFADLDDSSFGAGKSAYEVALDNGFVGTEAEWLATLVGPAGPSAYEVALAEGFVGTEAEWLDALRGAAGLSAYEVALDNGFVGSEAEWLESLNATPPVTALDANKILSNNGIDSQWVEVTHTLDGFVDAVEESLKLITVDQGDL